MAPAPSDRPEYSERRLLCCSLLGVVLLCGLAFAGALLVWEFRFNEHRETPCDKPLNAALLGFAVALFYLVALNLLTVANFRLWQTWVPYVAGVLLVYLNVWVVLANVWLWTSKTCQDSSRGINNPPWFGSLYDTAKVVVLCFDVIVGAGWLAFVAFMSSFEQEYRRLRQKKDKLTRFEHFREQHPNAHRVLLYGAGDPSQARNREDYQNV